MKLPGNLETRDVLVDGHRIHYAASVDSPAGPPPVVLIHGVGLSHRYLVPLATALAEHLPVLAPDLPGFGRSYKPWRVQTLPELADWTASWLEVVQAGPVSVLGQSLGCQVVAHLAAGHPARVHRVVLQGVTVDPAARTMAQQFVRWRRNQQVEKEGKEDAPPALPDYLRCGLRRIVKTYGYAIRDRPEDVVTGIRCPALVVHGDRDPIGSAAWARQVAARLPQGRLVMMEGVAHTISSDAPERLARLTVDFLLDQG